MAVIWLRCCPVSMSKHLQSFHPESGNRIKDMSFLNVSLNQKYYAQLLLDVTRVQYDFTWQKMWILSRKMQKISTFQQVDLQPTLPRFVNRICYTLTNDMRSRQETNVVDDKTTTLRFVTKTENICDYFIPVYGRITLLQFHILT